MKETFSSLSYSLSNCQCRAHCSLSEIPGTRPLECNKPPCGELIVYFLLLFFDRFEYQVQIIPVFYDDTL